MTGMQVNLGCGDRYVNRWWNVDVATCPWPKDEVVDLTGELPWPDGSLTHVYAGHVLEHIEWADAVQLLNRLQPKLMYGGELMIVGPDCDVAERLLGPTGSDEFGATLDSLVNGGHRWPGDEHRWRCTLDKMLQLLAHTRWTKIRQVDMQHVVEEGWPVADPRPRWQLALSVVNIDAE